ncbi:MAG: hypothetical protein AB8G95_24045 [Anaerolineae bacterium]
MEFPIKLQFKILALAPQITATDASGRKLFYVKQKLLKLKEEVKVYTDETQTEILYEINADRVIDFSAQYHFKDAQGNELGSIKRRGRRSLFKAHYDIFNNGEIVASIHEESGWSRFGDAMFSEIPIIGMFSGYIFNPTYLVTRPDGTDIVKIKKQKAMLESTFTIEEAVDINEAAEIRTVLAILMMTLLERSRS